MTEPCGSTVAVEAGVATEPCIDCGVPVPPDKARCDACRPLQIDLDPRFDVPIGAHEPRRDACAEDVPLPAKEDAMTKNGAHYDVRSVRTGTMTAVRAETPEQAVAEGRRIIWESWCDEADRPVRGEVFMAQRPGVPGAWCSGCGRHREGLVLRPVR